MTVLSPELISNCCMRSQRSFLPFVQHSHQGESTSSSTLQISQLRPRSAASGWSPNTELPDQHFDGFGPRLITLWMFGTHFHKILVGIIAIALQIPIETSGGGGSTQPTFQQLKGWPTVAQQKVGHKLTNPPTVELTNSQPNPPTVGLSNSQPALQRSLV